MVGVATGIGIAWAALAWLTADGSDLWRSPWWVLGWVLVPTAVALLARRSPASPAALAAAGAAPMAIAFVLYDVAVDDTGGATWPIGVALSAVMGAVLAVVAVSSRSTAS